MKKNKGTPNDIITEITYKTLHSIYPSYMCQIIPFAEHQTYSMRSTVFWKTGWKTFLKNTAIYHNCQICNNISPYIKTRNLYNFLLFFFVCLSFKCLLWFIRFLMEILDFWLEIILHAIFLIGYYVFLNSETCMY